MKIKTMQSRINRLTVRGLAICVAALTGLAANQAASQSALLDYIASNPNTPVQQHVAAPNRQISNGGEAYRVVGASSVKTAGDLRGPIGSAISGQRPVRQASCHSCGNNACGGACGNYNADSMGGYYDGGMACGIPCDPYWYVIGQGLYMERDRQASSTFMRGVRTQDFGFEWAPRVTIGRVPDCVHGCELTWTGPLEWDLSRSITGTGLDSNLVPLAPLTLADLSAFNDGVAQQETYNSEYWSVEASKTLIGWDVAKILLGGRYINYDEAFTYASRNGAGETGLLQSDVSNDLVGLQIGMDLLFPVGRFVYSDFRARGGAYIDFADADVRLTNAGTTIASGFDETAELAGVFELGGGFLVQLGEMLAIRGGYELWYIAGVATAPDQFRPRVTTRTGNSAQVDDDLFIYGLTLGADLRF